MELSVYLSSTWQWLTLYISTITDCKHRSLWSTFHLHVTVGNDLRSRKELLTFQTSLKTFFNFLLQEGTEASKENLFGVHLTKYTLRK